MVARDLPPGFSMKKWPGYSADSGRSRFQRRIPEDVRHAFNGAEWIRFPLNLPPGREAQRRAFGWWVAYEGEFNRIRQGYVGQSTDAAGPATPHLASLTLDQMREMFMPVADRLHLGQYERLITGATPHEDLVMDHQKLAEAVRDVVSGRGSTHLSFLAGLFLLSRNIAFDPLEPSFKRFVYVTATILHNGLISPVGKRLRGEVVEPPLPPATEGLGAGLQIPHPKGLTLGEVVDGYTAALPENHYKRKLVLCLTLLCESMGRSFLVADLKQIHIRDFLGLVCRLPSDWAKRRREQGVSLERLLAEEPEEVLSEQTYRDNYRATLTKFLGEAHRDHGDRGFPVLSADYPYKGDRSGEQDTQRHLDEHELVRLFTGREFRAIAADPKREALYWLPIIGLYTGARLREICQLNPQCDWGVEGGVWYLAFDENTPAGQGVKKTIKTGETRNVPLHPELIRLGLPEYLERMRKGGADRLFPSFRVKGGNPYTVAGVAFTELLKEVGIYDNQTKKAKVTGMYVFRKTFATYGDEQGVRVEPFVGHRQRGKTITQKHYITRAKQVPWLYEEFKHLDFKVKVPLRSYYSDSALV